MRFISAVAALVLMLTPAVFADAPTGDWSGETTVTVTSAYSTTLTITKTLTYAHVNTTTSTHSYHPTAWGLNSTTTQASTTIMKPTIPPTSSLPSAAPIETLPAAGAASANEINLAVAALAGAAAMVWGSL